MSVAVAGAFQWTWTQDPPPGVADALSALCPDVPYLGTTESPVRLTATSNRPAGEPGSQATHILDPQASMFAAVGQDVEVPVPGRLTELTAAHRSMTGRSPSLAKDRYGTDETSQSPVPPREAVAVARYAPVQAPAQDVPWPQVVLLPVDQKIKERHRVRWAVAVHRALIRIIGDGAPPLVTGIYPQPASRPANRLAVQVVDDSMPVDLPAGVKCAIALMIPAGVEAGDLAVLAAAVENLTILYGPSGSVQPLQVAGPVAMAGGRFWRPRPVGTVRVLGTQPPAVPDVRGVRGVEWTFAHAALLSVGFVLKSRLGPVPGRRDARYLNVVDAVTAAGAAVLDVRPERTTGVQDYAHTVHAHAVIRPYRARLVLGDLVTDQALLSIGQSRHLGGGLLVPVDLPEGAPMSDAALPPQGRAR